MLDAKGIKSLLKISMPRVSYSSRWYLKRTGEEINMKMINLLINMIEAKNFKIYPEDEGFYLKRREEDILLEDKNEENPAKSYKELILKDPKDKINEYVKVRIINHTNFIIPHHKNLWSYLKCCLGERNITRNAMIIHIHGGGFIAMSASSHENYTRKWTNALGVPVISIDYRLAPLHPYPFALDDVYQAYLWIIDNAEEVFKMNLEKIILVGDSAGGNLAVALTYLLIMLKKRLPTAVFLAYPGIK